MATLPAERKALVFSVGGVRLALRLSQVLEIVSAEVRGGEVQVRGRAVPALPLSVTLGLGAAHGGFALVIEASPPLALRVEALHGIVDLAGAEVFQLPARTALPQPPPFQGAIVVRGEIALELAVAALGWAPLEPAGGPLEPLPSGPLAERELLFARAGRSYAVPLSLLLRVLEAVRVFPVPLAPPAHRGLLYHGRALHPVFDVAAIYGESAPAGEARTVLLLDAGGTAVGLLAERVLGVGEASPGEEVTRPAWDALFAA
jgi:chemotaxis signal transduction protein